MIAVTLGAIIKQNIELPSSQLYKVIVYHLCSKHAQGRRTCDVNDAGLIILSGWW